MPNGYDVVAFFSVIGGLVAPTHSVHEMRAPLVDLDMNPGTLDLWKLPDSALRTTLRMFAAMAASLVFTFVVATLAAKSRQEPPTRVARVRRPPRSAGSSFRRCATGW